jgi:threonyl-tRNA synthetase
MPEDKLYSIRHSLAHLLAMAILEHDPKARPAIGPVIDTGFYYDFDLSKPIEEKDLEKLGKRMREFISQNLSFSGEEIKPLAAKEFFEQAPYKLELIDEFVKEGKKLTIFKTGNFTDLCAGGHVESTKEINPQAFKLTKITGAYWRGSEKNKMLTRIYGVAFSTEEELKEYIHKQEEGAKRDHRKLGKELDLFTFSDLVGSGLPLFTPRGTLIRNELQNALLSISKKYGMQPVTIPHIAKEKLYEISGHAIKFGDELIKVKSHYDDFVMKPVNCPHHTQIYASRQRSYRDLPLRYMETTMQYRDEKPGEIGGLTRVRAITVDDGHIFCTPDQIKNEAKNIAEIIREFYTGLGLYGSHWVSLSVRDSKHPEKYIGEDADWNKAEKMLAEISDELSLSAKRIEGEAAIYGPKLDFIFKDSLGREWQLATIQIDFSMPKRFSLTYVDTDGKEKTPVMIHRAILGSYERFMAILIEHFAGAFPLWLSPVHISILPIGEKHVSYGKEIFEKLAASGIRAELRDENDTLGKKISTVKREKVPYFAVIGDQEVGGKTITLESRNGASKEVVTIEKLTEKLNTEIRDRKI